MHRHSLPAAPAEPGIAPRRGEIWLPPRAEAHQARGEKEARP